MSTSYQQLLDAVHDLLNEINESDYVDMVGSDVRLNRVEVLTGYFETKPMDLVDSDPFRPVLYSGAGNAEINKRNRETMTVLPPRGWSTPIAPIDEAVEELKWALEELEHTRSDDDYDRVIQELNRIQKLADSMISEE